MEMDFEPWVQPVSFSTVERDRETEPESEDDGAPATPSTLRAFYKKITTFIESAIASPFTLGDSTKRSTALHQSSYPEIS